MDFIEKTLNTNQQALILSFCIGIAFWTALDSLLLAIPIAYVFYIVFQEEAKKKDKKKN